MEFKRSHYFIILAITALEIATHWGWWHCDSESYISTMNYLFGESGGMRSEHRILRPFTLLLVFPLTKVIGEPAAFAIVNSAFWLATSLLMYRFSYLLLRNYELALISSVAFTISSPMLVFGAAVLTDAGGYFFILLSFCALYFYRDSDDIRTYFILGSILALGTLTREHTLPFFIGYLVVYELLSGRRRWKRIIYISIIGCIPILIYYAFFKINPLFQYFFAKEHGWSHGIRDGTATPRLFLYSILTAFWFLPIFSVLGCLKEKNRTMLIHYIAMTVPMLAVLLPYISYDARFTFLLFPVVLPLASIGMRELSSKLESLPVFSLLKKWQYEVAILFIYAVFTNVWAYLFSLPSDWGFEYKIFYVYTNILGK